MGMGTEMVVVIVLVAMTGMRIIKEDGKCEYLDWCLGGNAVSGHGH